MLGSFSLRISSIVEGAKIFVDGEYVGMTDASGTLVVQMTAGEHTVRAEKEGYNPAEATINVPDQLSVTLYLVKKTYQVTIVVEEA